jgi:thioesterase domain-containing protein/acyl carrier protein
MTHSTVTEYSSADTSCASPSDIGRTAQQNGLTLWGLFQALAKEQSKMPPVQPSVARTGTVPLSFAQERLYELHRLETQDIVYNVSLIQRLKGPLNISALEQGINEIIHRHEVLRTVLPSQEVMSGWEKEVPVTDCRSFPDPENETRQRISEEARKPFDLCRAPLLHARLFQIDSDDHVLLLLLHQICCDDPSLRIIARELSVLYHAFAAGKPSPLPALSVQYADFACWQRELLQGEELEKLSAYWKKQLTGRLPRMNFLSRRHSGTVAHFFEISSDLHGALKTFSKQNDVTLFITLLAALQSLLLHCTGQEDMLVFSSFGGRNRRELKPLIGLFANILLLRTDMSGNPSFPEILSRVRETMFGAIIHQDMPFDKLLEMLHSETGQTPSFQVLFTLMDMSADLCLSGTETESFMPEENGAGQFDLMLYCRETPQGLKGMLRYREGLCEAAPYMAETFQELLKEITADPERWITDFPCLAQLPQSAPETAAMPEDAPESVLELQLVNIWKRILQTDVVGRGDSFFNLGGNSLLAIELFVEIEKQFGRQLPLASLIKAPTVRLMAELIEDAGYSSPSSPLVPIQPDGAKIPFFYVPPAGKTALRAVYHARHLGADQPVYGIQPLGFEEGEVPHNQTEEMAAYYIKAIQKDHPEGPYCLGGTCFGATVVFEMAQQLQAQGCTVSLLALFDPGPPLQIVPDAKTSKSPSEKAAYYLRQLFYHIRKGQLLHAFLDFSFQRRRHLMRRKLKTHTPEQRRIHTVMDAHEEAFRKYVPHAYSGKTVLFRSSEYHEKEKEGRNIWARSWAEFITGEFYLHVLQGIHYEIFQGLRSQELAEILKGYLDKEN